MTLVRSTCMKSNKPNNIFVSLIYVCIIHILYCPYLISGFPQYYFCIINKKKLYTNTAASDGGGVGKNNTGLKCLKS